MARVRAILAALWTALRRDGKSLGSFTGNNLFLMSVIFLFLKDPGAFLMLNLFIGLVLFLPLSADPLRKIPATRLALWPLTARERRFIRVASPWFNPVTWLLVALALWRSVTIGLWATAAGLFAVGFVLPFLPVRHGSWRSVPAFPGRLGQLVRKNLRELLATLDFYCGLVVSVVAVALRAAKLLPSEALLPLTILVMLALSTPALNLFGLDGPGGLTRYRLLPARGWQILAAKDSAFLLVAVVLTLPLAPLAGLSAALAALAAGRYTSVNQRRDETRWRFSTAPSFTAAIVEILAMAFAAAATHSLGPLLLLPALAVYVASTWWFGQALDR